MSIKWSIDINNWWQFIIGLDHYPFLSVFIDHGFHLLLRMGNIWVKNYSFGIVLLNVFCFICTTIFVYFLKGECGQGKRGFSLRVLVQDWWSKQKAEKRKLKLDKNKILHQKVKDVVFWCWQRDPKCLHLGVIKLSVIYVFI